MEFLKQTDGFLCYQGRNCIYHGTNIRKSSSFRLFYPFIRISVPIKYNAVMLSCILFDEIMNRLFKIIRLFQHITCLWKRICNNCIQHNVRSRDRIPGSYHTEFKFISCKRKRWCSVSVCRILCQFWKCSYTSLQLSAFQTVCCFPCTDQLIDHIFQLFSKEYGNNCRRCFVCSQSVIISRICCRFSQKIRMLVNRLQNASQNKQELNILMWCCSRIQHIDSIICNDRPVVVLSGTVDACKWFFMKETFHSVLACDPL